MSLFLLGVLVLASGCGMARTSDPYASPPGISDRMLCESRGGYWNRNAGVCEAPLLR